MPSSPRLLVGSQERSKVCTTKAATVNAPAALRTTASAMRFAHTHACTHTHTQCNPKLIRHSSAQSKQVATKGLSAEASVEAPVRQTSAHWLNTALERA